MNKQFLFVLWAGGGNVPPQITLARRLAVRGHGVRVLAPAALRDKVESAGLIFEPYHEAPEHDEAVPERSLVRDFEQRTSLGAASAVRDHLLAGMAAPIAADVLSILERERIDVVAADHLLPGALFAAEKANVPAAMLVHTVYPFPGAGLPPFGMGWTPMAGPLGSVRDVFGWTLFRRAYERPLMPPLNKVRTQLGLARISSFSDLLALTARALVLTSPAFEFPAALPFNVRYVGAQLEEPEWTTPWASPWPADDPRPLVVVGLSTTYQAHDDLVRRTIEALGSLPVRAVVSTGALAVANAPSNVHLERFVPHPRVLPLADVVVTHAGLGTVHGALAHGRPLVCLPISRDQPDNAARVAWHGAGLRLGWKSSPTNIASAVQTVLHGHAFAEAASRLGAAMQSDDAAEAGASALESLAPVEPRFEDARAAGILEGTQA